MWIQERKEKKRKRRIRVRINGVYFIKNMRT